MAGDLDDVLEGKEAAVTTDAPAEQVEVEASQADETGEQSEQAAETPPAPEVTPTPDPKEEKVPLAALMAEREKRRKAEEAARRAQAQPVHPPSFYESPEVYVQTVMKQQTFAMSEAMAREMYQDYDEVIEEFVEYAQDKPALQAELNTSAHPALFAYKQGKALREYREIKDVPALKAKIEAETRAELEARIRAELEAKFKAEAATRQSLPPDLTAARSTRAPEPKVDVSLDSILKTKR